MQAEQAVFKEDYLLRKENIAEYGKFTVDCFELSVSSANAKMQIHKHMYYSKFNNIFKTIDADAISIKTAHNSNELLKIFKEVSLRIYYIYL